MWDKMPLDGAARYRESVRTVSGVGADATSATGVSAGRVVGSSLLGAGEAAGVGVTTGAGVGVGSGAGGDGSGVGSGAGVGAT